MINNQTGPCFFSAVCRFVLQRKHAIISRAVDKNTVGRSKIPCLLYLKANVFLSMEQGQILLSVRKLPEEKSLSCAL